MTVRGGDGALGRVRVYGWDGERKTGRETSTKETTRDHRGSPGAYGKNQIVAADCIANVSETGGWHKSGLANAP